MATKKRKKSGGRRPKKNSRASAKLESGGDSGPDENKPTRDSVIRGSIHASPRAWLELISSRPLEACSLERLDTQGSLIDRRPDALYRVRKADREWIYCVEAQSGSDRDMGRRFLIALVMLLIEARSTKNWSGFVPMELRVNERSRVLNPNISYRWGFQGLSLSWICSNALLERNGKVAELPLTLDTVTIHAWHVGTTKERIERLCDWTEAQDADEDEKSLILCLLRLTGRVRFGVDARRIPRDQEYAAMNQARLKRRADESLYHYTLRELEAQALERDEKVRQEVREEVRRAVREELREEVRREVSQEVREEERAALLSLAKQVLPKRIDALRALGDLEELRGIVHAAVAELAAKAIGEGNGNA